MKKSMKIFTGLIACVGLVLAATSCSSSINELQTSYTGSMEATPITATGNDGTQYSITIGGTDYELEYYESKTNTSIFVDGEFEVYSTEVLSDGTKDEDKQKIGEHISYQLLRDEGGLFFFFNSYKKIVTSETIPEGGSSVKTEEFVQTKVKVPVTIKGKTLSYTLPVKQTVKFNPDTDSFEDDIVELKYTFTKK